MFEGIKITDIVSSVSAAIAAVTGVVMAWLAYKGFLKAPEQEEVEDERSSEENVHSPAKNLTVFKTSKQTTILRIVEDQLECEIIDTREGKGGVQWVLPQDVCQRIVSQKLVRANPNYKARTGLVTIGPKKNWLYSKALYWDPEVLENDIYSLLEGEG